MQPVEETRTANNFLALMLVPDVAYPARNSIDYNSTVGLINIAHQALRSFLSPNKKRPSHY